MTVLQITKYNEQNQEWLPNITSHILKHTFCTRLANASMNSKALQHIIGHTYITMIWKYYAYAAYDSAKKNVAFGSMSTSTFFIAVLLLDLKLCQEAQRYTQYLLI